MQIGLGGSKPQEMLSSWGFSELLRSPTYCCVRECKLSKIVEILLLTGLCNSIMYAKTRVKNWTTLFEINTSKEPKIKSVTQFYFSISCRDKAVYGYFRYALSSAKANPSKPTGTSSRRPPANIKQTISAGKAITKSIIATTFVRLHATLNTRTNTLINSQTNRIVQSISSNAISSN